MAFYKMGNLSLSFMSAKVQKGRRFSFLMVIQDSQMLCGQIVNTYKSTKWLIYELN